MYWPLMTDYQEAIQNPKFCFNDAELRDGVVDFDQLGFPRPISGNFACVFNITHQHARWAVRCFLQNNQDQEKRYDCISAYLTQYPLPYFVPFKFIRDGIKVKGKWYPILKMEWINGETLTSYIEKNLNHPGLIEALSQKFLTMTHDLEERSIAHGDLQHGNMIIVRDEIKLVDYDGMYVPDLAGMLSNEIGHPNYQHPKRNEHDFGPWIDRFSEWVIYLSLRALSIDPTLWKMFKGGDENLIFRRTDYESPLSSDSFAFLETQGINELPRIAAFLREAIDHADLQDVPKLDKVALLKLNQTGLAHRQTKEGSPPATVNPLWVLDHLEAVKTIEIPAELKVEQTSLVSLAVSLFFTSVLFAARILAAEPFSFLFVMESLLDMAFLYIRYSMRAEVKEKRVLSASLDQNRSKSGQVVSKIEGLNQRIAEISKEEKEMLHDLNQQRQLLRRRERDEIIEVETGLRKRLVEIKEQLSQISNDENKELANILAILQEEFINHQLIQYRLDKATIRGIGEEMKKRLMRVGIMTAADLLDYHIGVSRWRQFEKEQTYLKIKGQGDCHVDGVGPAKAKALVAWRRALEEQHRPGAPQALPPIISTAVITKYANQRISFNNQLAAVGREADQKKSSIHSRYQADMGRNQNDAIVVTRVQIAKKKEQEDKISAALRDKSQLSWESSVLEKQMAAYKNVNFAIFLRKVLQIG